jgi:beta-lactam-binding protein with PASTA domain
VVLSSLAAAAAVIVGLLTASGVFSGGESHAFPAPARVPQVIGLTKQAAVHKVEAARLVPVVHYTRAGSNPHGRVVGVSMGSLLHAKGHLPPISLEGSPIGLIVAR